MANQHSYTIEEVSQLLKVSKLTVYDLAKKGELTVFRVGRQMRIDADDLDDFIQNRKTSSKTSVAATAAKPPADQSQNRANIVISGQDMVLDILGKQIEKNSSYKTLRSYNGSLNSLISMYNDECDIVSLHLFDGDTGEYNLPYLKKVLVGQSYIVLNLISRKAGLYVQKGNPLKINSWKDLNNNQIKMINREKGSGARILLDEQLRIHQIPPKNIRGYENEESNHISVASAVSTGSVDVGVGTEKAAKMVGVDFVSLITERYDLVILKKGDNEKLIDVVKEILSSQPIQSEINAVGDYDISQIGTVIYET